MLRANCSVIVRSSPPPVSGWTVSALSAAHDPGVVSDCLLCRYRPPRTRLHGPVQDVRALQQRRQSRARPACIADAAVIKKGAPVLPEHSNVNSTSWRSRALRSAIVSERGWATKPPMLTRQLASSRPSGWP